MLEETRFGATARISACNWMSQTIFASDWFINASLTVYWLEKK